MSAADLPDLLSLSRRIIDGGELTREEARQLFALEGEELYDLFYAAHKVRRHFHGNRVTFCSILPTKFGNCGEDCKFCAQSGHFDTGITAHPMMDGAEVAKACTDARDRGASAFGIVNSGRGPTKREWPKIMEAVQAMKDVDGICHCATLGTLSEEQALDLKAAGVRRINHNLETSREFYPQIVTTHTWQERVDTVRLAQRVGLETCCGCIFGMGETIEDRVSLAFSLATRWGLVLSIGFWVATIAVLQRMGKADPMLRHIYMRHIRYRVFYPAKSRPSSLCLQTPNRWR